MAWRSVQLWELASAPRPLKGRSPPILSKLALANSSGGGGDQIGILFSLMCHSMELGSFSNTSQALLGPLSVLKRPKAPQIRKPMDMFVNKEKQTYLTPCFYRQMSALCVTNKCSNTYKISRFGKWACPKCKLLPDPITFILSMPRGSQVSWSE